MIFATRDKWHKKGSSLHISDERWAQLTNDQIIKLREMHSKRRSAYFASLLGFFGVILTVIGGGLFIRDSDLNKIYNRIDGTGGQGQSEVLIRVQNIEREIIELRKQGAFDQKLAWKIKFEVNALYCKEHPEQCKNQFGYYTGKREDKGNGKR